MLTLVGATTYYSSWYSTRFLCAIALSSVYLVSGRRLRVGCPVSPRPLPPSLSFLSSVYWNGPDGCCCSSWSLFALSTIRRERFTLWSAGIAAPSSGNVTVVIGWLTTTTSARVIECNATETDSGTKEETGRTIRMRRRKRRRRPQRLREEFVAFSPLTAPFVVVFSRVNRSPLACRCRCFSLVYVRHW